MIDEGFIDRELNSLQMSYKTINDKDYMRKERIVDLMIKLLKLKELNKRFNQK